MESANWIWGLSLVVLTIAIHATGVVVLALLGSKTRVRIANRRFAPWSVIPIVIGLVAAAGLLLAMLHGIEAGICSCVFVVGCDRVPLGCNPLFGGSLSTRGASGLTLQEPWRMMGALEAVDGVLLFGISTAYIFSHMQTYWPMLYQRPSLLAQSGSPLANVERKTARLKRPS